MAWDDMFVVLYVTYFLLLLVGLLLAPQWDSWWLDLMLLACVMAWFGTYVVMCAHVGHDQEDLGVDREHEPVSQLS